jgi:hypothetical protein
MLRRTWEHMASLLTGIPSVSEVRRDPWRRLPFEPPLRAFGPGACDDFATYLMGVCTVGVQSPYEAAQWLLSCRYASDPELHGEVDAWLHPATLELVRSGDCEDFALWGWRKLVELGLDARFIVGTRHLQDGTSQRHAWVVYRAEDGEFLFDGVEKSVSRIVRLLADVRAEYEPQVGVTPVAARYVYAGLFLSDWGRRLSLRRLPDTE